MNQIIILASLLKVLVFVKRNFYLHMQASCIILHVEDFRSFSTFRNVHSRHHLSNLHT